MVIAFGIAKSRTRPKTLSIPAVLTENSNPDVVMM